MTDEKIVKKRNPSWNNIISMGDRTVEERKAIGRLGGIKSGESKRRMKTFKEELMAILETQTKNSKGESITIQQNINAAIALKAAKGDVRAYEVIRDTLGQKPKDEKEVVVVAEGGLKVNLDLVKRMEDHFEGNK